MFVGGAKRNDSVVCCGEWGGNNILVAVLVVVLVGCVLLSMAPATTQNADSKLSLVHPQRPAIKLTERSRMVAVSVVGLRWPRRTIMKRQEEDFDYIASMQRQKD